jgi:hypothetical protein
MANKIVRQGGFVDEKTKLMRSFQQVSGDMRTQIAGCADDQYVHEFFTRGATDLAAEGVRLAA